MSERGRTWPTGRFAAAVIAMLGLVWLALPARADTAPPPLVVAAAAGDVKTLDTLLAGGADPNTTDAGGVSALEWAAGRGGPDAAKALLAAHAAVDGAYNPQKYTPLMRAAYFGHADVAAVLIAAGADVNARAADGQSVLDFAVHGADPDVLALLTQHGAQRGRGRGAGDPQALCNVAASAGFYAEDFTWKADPANPARFLCFAGTHDLPGGAGNTLMYGYQVDGTAKEAELLRISVDIYDDSLPTEAIAKTLRPLLTALWAVGGHGPAPADLIETLSAAREARQDTPLGDVTATYQPGKNPSLPFNGARYDIAIRLH